MAGKSKEHTVIGEMKTQTSGSWYGPFKIKAKEMIPADKALEIAVLLNYSTADVDEIQRSSTPGLTLLIKMEQRNQLSENNDEDLISAMESVNLQGPAKSLRDYISKSQGKDETRSAARFPRLETVKGGIQAMSSALRRLSPYYKTETTPTSPEEESEILLKEVNNCFSFAVINELMVHFEFTATEVERVYPVLLSIHKFVYALIEKDIVSERKVDMLLMKLKDIGEEHLAKTMKGKYEESKMKKEFDSFVNSLVGYLTLKVINKLMHVFKFESADIALVYPFSFAQLAFVEILYIKAILTDYSVASLTDALKKKGRSLVAKQVEESFNHCGHEEEDYLYRKTAVGSALSITVINELMLEFDFSNGDIAQAYCATISKRKFVHALVEKEIISKETVDKLVDSLRKERLAAEIQKKFENSSNEENEFSEFLQWLEKKVDLKHVIRLLDTFGFTSIEIINIFESVHYKRMFLNVLKEKRVISSDNIKPLMTALIHYKRFEVAKLVKASFEGYARENGENGENGTPIYKYTTEMDREEQEIRILECDETILNEDAKIRLCNIGRGNCDKKRLKVIMIFGKCGVGKTTMVNALVNKILGVTWEDSFRYKIPLDVEEAKCRSTTSGQTQWISVYYMHGNNIAIVDAPGFCSELGSEKDKEITDQIRTFFCLENSPITYVNMIAFVMMATECRLNDIQRNVFNLVLGLFGKDVEEQIYLFATFADGMSRQIAVAEAARSEGVKFTKSFRFDNGALYTPKADQYMQSMGDSDSENESTYQQMLEDEREMLKLKWRLSDRNLKEALKRLQNSPEVSIDTSALVLKNQNALQIILHGILETIESAVVRIAELEQDKIAAASHEKELENSTRFQFDVVKEHIKQKDISPNYALVCETCKRTCHSMCTAKFRIFCSAMRFMAIFRGCGVCDNNCGFTEHELAHYKYYRVKRQDKKDDRQLIAENKAGRKVTDIIYSIERRKRETHQILEGKIGGLKKCLRELNDKALQPNTKTAKEYLNDMKRRERSNGEVGWEERVQFLEILLQREQNE